MSLFNLSLSFSNRYDPSPEPVPPAIEWHKTNPCKDIPVTSYSHYCTAACAIRADCVWVSKHFSSYSKYLYKWEQLHLTVSPEQPSNTCLLPSPSYYHQTFCTPHPANIHTHTYCSIAHLPILGTQEFTCSIIMWGHDVNTLKKLQTSEGKWKLFHGRLGAK